MGEKSTFGVSGRNRLWNRWNRFQHRDCRCSVRWPPVQTDMLLELRLLRFIHRELRCMDRSGPVPGPVHRLHHRDFRCLVRFHRIRTGSSQETFSNGYFFSPSYKRPVFLLEQVGQPLFIHLSSLSHTPLLKTQKLQDLHFHPTKYKSLWWKARGDTDLQPHQAILHFPLSSSSYLLLLGLLGNPRRLGSPGSIRVVDLLRGSL